MEIFEKIVRIWLKTALVFKQLGKFILQKMYNKVVPSDEQVQKKAEVITTFVMAVARRGTVRKRADPLILYLGRWGGSCTAYGLVQYHFQ